MIFFFQYINTIIILILAGHLCHLVILLVTVCIVHPPPWVMANLLCVLIFLKFLNLIFSMHSLLLTLLFFFFFQCFGLVLGIELSVLGYIPSTTCSAGFLVLVFVLCLHPAFFESESQYAFQAGVELKATLLSQPLKCPAALLAMEQSLTQLPCWLCQWSSCLSFPSSLDQRYGPLLLFWAFITCFERMHGFLVQEFQQGRNLYEANRCLRLSLCCFHLQKNSLLLLIQLNCQKATFLLLNF